MQSLPIYLNVDGHVATPVDAYNAVRSTPPALMRGVRALLCLRLVDDEGNPDDTGIAALVGWEFVLAGDWDTDTDPEIRVTSGIAVVSTTVGTNTFNEIQIPLTELNTEELISKLGNSASVDLGAELVGFEEGETDPGFLIQFTMRVYNRRSTAGTGTPTPVDDGLYSAVQIDSLLAAYYTSVQVDAKLSGYALSTHNHDGVYATAVHSHAIGDVTGLLAELDAKASAATVETHLGNTENPHAVTASQIGLDQVNNTSDVDKPVSTAMQAALDGKADIDHNHDAAYAAKSSEHTHDNLTVLNKFSENSSGQPLYDGESIGGGETSSGSAWLSSDFFVVNPGIAKSAAIGGGGSFTGGLTGIADYAIALPQNFLTSTYQLF